MTKIRGWLKKVKVVIMAGGQGTRFWPWSIEKKPKQFLSLISKKTMIQETFDRYKEWLSIDKIFVVTTEEYKQLVIDQLPNLPQEQIILEPERRDTAPCVALTAMFFQEKLDDEVLVMCPADQYISDAAELKESLHLAEKIAEKDNNIVTLGINPTRPETGYGYIKAASEKADKILKVERFIEKPTEKYAEKLLNSDNVFWNSGIFIWKPSTIAHYMEKYQYYLWNTLKNNQSQIKEVYSKLPKISVDYAILEKVNCIYTIPAKFEWDDLGTWRSLERIYNQDSGENILIGNVNVLSSSNCTIISDNQDLVVLGVSDLIIVSTADGLLICHKSQEQEIKKALNLLSNTKAVGE